MRGKVAVGREDRAGGLSVGLSYLLRSQSVGSSAT